MCPELKRHQREVWPWWPENQKTTWLFISIMLVPFTPFLCQPFAYTRSGLGYLKFLCLQQGAIHYGAQLVPGEMGAGGHRRGTPPSHPHLLPARFLLYRRPKQPPGKSGTRLLFPRLGVYPTDPADLNFSKKNECFPFLVVLGKRSKTDLQKPH